MDSTPSMPWPETLQEAVIYFNDPDRALAAAMTMRWKDGPVTCPTCGSTKVHFIETRRIWRCGTQHPRRQFSVKIGTVMEDSPLGLDKWMVGIWLLSSAKNGISSYELHRSIGITQKSAWFLLHRIRLAMHGKPGPFSGHVEADETWIGGKARNMHTGRKARVLKGRESGVTGKIAVFGMLERNRGDKASRVVDKRRSDGGWAVDGHSVRAPLRDGGTRRRAAPQRTGSLRCEVGSSARNGANGSGHERRRRFRDGLYGAECRAAGW